MPPKTSILITGARAPVALHMARLLSAAGHSVTLADHLRYPVSAAGRFSENYRIIPPFTAEPDGAAAALAEIIRKGGVSLVIPTCEEVLHLGALWARLSPSTTLLAPEFGLLKRAHNKYDFISLCSEIGLSTPETHLLTSTDDLGPLRPSAQEMVFKPVWSRFGSEVLIRPNAAELRRIEPTREAPWVAQSFLDGNEICVYAIAREGRLVALSAYRALVRARSGAAVSFEPVEANPVRSFAEKFVGATGWNGQVSFDLIQSKDGQVRPLECNPRATSGLHFFTDGSAFSEAVLGRGNEIYPDVSSPLSVRLALWLYGLPKILRRQERRQFGDALRRSGDVMCWPGDTVGLGAQMRSGFEIARIALQHGIGLERASTWGIEWNGEDQRSIS